MARYSINLVKEPNIELFCNLTDDKGTVFAVDIALRHLQDGSLCANIDVNGDPQHYGVLVHNKMPLLPSDILGGNIYFEDQYGNDDPVYTEYGDRFLLIYDTEFKLG